MSDQISTSTFFTVIAVDFVAVSLLTHKLRVWFPVWLDAHWATRPDPWVVYSQSYFAGIVSTPRPGQLLRRLPGINPRVDLARQFEGLAIAHPSDEKKHARRADQDEDAKCRYQSHAFPHSSPGLSKSSNVRRA